MEKERKMELTAEPSPEDFTNHRCYLPTSDRERELDLPWQSIDIRGLDCSGDTEANTKNIALSEDVVLASWAVLLRCYTGCELASFAALLSAHPREAGDSKSSSGVVRPRCENRLRDYRVTDHALLRDIQAEQSQLYDRVDPKDRQVNTAVYISQSACVCHGESGERILSTLIEPNVEDHFDLILYFGQDCQHVTLYHRAPVINKDHAISIASTFGTILRHAAVNKDVRVCQTLMPSGRDLGKILSWNPSDRFTHAGVACMHELVELKARSMPEAEAVCGWDGSLTYLALNEFADITASQLASKGVRPGIYVPVAYEKSIWAVVAMLGILKAGGALVPLNSTDPSARLEQTLRSIKADVVATSENFKSKFDLLVKHVMVVSRETLLPYRGNEFHPKGPLCLRERTFRSNVKPSDTMLVLFTSGSTGRPKGMIHTHASITCHAMTHGAAMSYGGARVLQFAAYTFDVAIIDIFTTLLFGGCICIPSESDRKSNIISVINTMRVDYAILTPSFAGLIDPTMVPTLQTLAVGGEALPQDRIHRWADKVNLLQIYGPAEVGICLFFKMESSTPGAVVGFPLNNSSCWLVDPNDISRLVPIGAVGELVVAGPSLAQGYLNDEARTQLSFIDPPAWASRMGLPFKRFYKTGDLLRYNVDAFDGSFMFIGRKDAQIKLRGQRIEPGEIEYHIGQLPGVAFSMVARPVHGCFSGRLVAILQMQRSDDTVPRVIDENLQLAEVQKLTSRDIRDSLATVLPAYMIPTECLVICNMPFVPSLKIDRRQVYRWLTSLERRPLSRGLMTLSVLSLEEAKAKALCSHITRVLAAGDEEQCLLLDGHDFRLQDTGMDSIKAISLSMFLRREYNVDVPVDVLLDGGTTVRGLAGWIDNAKDSSSNNSSPHTISSPFHSKSINAHEEALALSQSLLKSIKAKRSLTSAENLHRQTQNILLTGANGYLGITILHQLMSIPDIQVFALIRCSDPASGLQKIKDIGTRDGWWRSAYARRIVVWPGDLAAPDLGLSPTHQNQLNALAPTMAPTSDSHVREQPQIDTIIHAGAKVHYTLPYTTLFPVNVSSTVALLRIAALSPHIHTYIHVSGGESPHTDSVATDTAYLEALGVASGYTLTKNVAERIVRDVARVLSCPSASSNVSDDKRILVVKPGHIIGSRSTGFRANTADFIWRVIAGSLEIGAYNADDENWWVFVDDVESVACRVVKGIVSSSSPSIKRGYADDAVAPDVQPYGTGHVERILSGLQYGSIWRILEDVYARRFEALPADIWMRKLRDRAIEMGEKGLLFPLLGVLEKETMCVDVHVGPRDSYKRDVAVLDGASMTDEQLQRIKGVVEGNVRWLIDVGFLPAIGFDEPKVRFTDC